MTGPLSPLPAVLPSLQGAYESARAAAAQRAAVFVIGQHGSGRTTFAHQLLAEADGNVYWLTAAKAIQGVPFAMLTALCAQLPTSNANFTPGVMLSELFQYTSKQPLCIFLDQAEYTDEQSAAVLAQLSLTRNILLVMATTAVHRLPKSLRDLRAGPQTQRVELSVLSYEDAEATLKGVLGGQVNTSTVEALLEFSGGNALHLRELTLDAQTANALTLQRSYWTLDRRWIPQGPRISDLITSRLHEQPHEIREAIELLAVTGRLHYPLAQRLLGDALPEVLDSRLVELVVLSEDDATGERELAVALSSGLAPQTVLSTLTQTKLRGYLQRADKAFPREQLTSQARAWFTGHRVQLGLDVSADELFEDVVGSAEARHFAQVVALTDSIEHSSYTDERKLEKILVLRADALYELGKAEAALAVLKPLFGTGSAKVRGVAANIAFAGLGRIDLATEIIDSWPENPAEIRAYRLLLLSRAQQAMDSVKLREYAADSSITPELRAACLAHVLIEDCYAGRPVDSLQELSGLIKGDFWKKSSPAVQSELVYAILAVMTSVGGGGPEFAETLAGIDFTSVALNPANYLSGWGVEFLEQGLGLRALDALEQALALISVSDPYLVAGFTASFAAAGAVMVGDSAKAGRYYAMACAAPKVAGQIMRPMAQRYLLPVILELEGRAAAQEHLAQCLALADKFGRKLLRMQLLHDAWRLHLVEDATQLSETAAQVQGPMAQTFAEYARVMDSPTEADVRLLAEAHVSAGRLLYAGEVAHRAAVRARDLGQRKLATRLVALSAELASPLAEVNTPSLGRGRIVRSLLTVREYATCVLAARGASNQEIAEELFLSPRTVEGHLQRSYTKLGITDRRQLLPVSDATPITDEILDETSGSVPVSWQRHT